MALEDGEYELDVSCLLDSGVEGSFALRYGFIPDSMDQTKPLILYQNEQETLLRASGTEASGDSMIFEGVTQQIRLATNSSNEQYYLSYHGDSGENKVVLKKLDTTIRLSKSRNTKALMGKISQWEKTKLESTAPEITNQRLQIPKTQRLGGSSDSQTRSSNSSNLGSPNKSGTFSKTNTSAKSTSPSKLNSSNTTSVPTPQRPGSQVASKRPPVSRASTPDISNGDFEGLDDEEISFPTFTINGETEVSNKVEEPKNLAAPKKRETRSQKESKEPTKPQKTTKNTTTAPRKPRVKRATKTVPKQGSGETSDIDMDDAFKDLEDQLQEVLEEENVSAQIPHNDNRNNNNDNNNNKNKTIKTNSTNNNDQNPKPSTIGASNSNSIASNIINDSYEDESDEDDYGYSNNPFMININEGEGAKSATKEAYTANSGLKPMSLRDLVGNKKDDMSSSEEE